MTTTPHQLRAAVAHYVDTVNGRDPVAIAALFTEDAVQADPASQPPNVGHVAITIAVQVGWGTMRISGIEVFEAADDGRFRSAHAYWDDADVEFA